jgi:hypothetical protein
VRTRKIPTKFQQKRARAILREALRKIEKEQQKMARAILRKALREIERSSSHKITR